MKIMKIFFAIILSLNLNALTEKSSDAFSELKSKNIDCVSIRLSVTKDEENFNQDLWLEVESLAKKFDVDFKEFKNDDGLIDKSVDLIKTVYELVKDEKTLHGNLDISLFAKRDEEEKKVIESDEIILAFFVERDEKDFDQNKWEKIVESGVELARYGESSEEFNEEFLSKIKELIQAFYDFGKYNNDVLEIKS
ncbi:MAG: hypothetical protein ABIA74_00270 [bacterium]